MSQGHTVRVVVDSEFGEQLERLAKCDPVWIIDSPANTPVAHRLWKEPDRDQRFGGITTFIGSAASQADIGDIQPPNMVRVLTGGVAQQVGKDTFLLRALAEVGTRTNPLDAHLSHMPLNSFAVDLDSFLL